MAASPFAPQYIHGVYIPSALLLFGTYIVRSEWMPYAVGLAILLGSWKVYSSCRSISLEFQRIILLILVLVPRKVLDPNRKDYQEFELKEKTILSHNTAMYGHYSVKTVASY
jgi:cytochrome-b5 reductase